MSGSCFLCCSGDQTKYEWGSVSEEDLMMFSEQTPARNSSFISSRLSRDRMSIAMEDLRIAKDDRLSEKSPKSVENEVTPRDVLDTSSSSSTTAPSPRSKSTIPNNSTIYSS
mmetsp:Transcript_25825/g.61237  ORF Transcript_25825/g.61237 Transcript_25825/m.61237 type:complete len:112 (-) Transcript_25825:111-446(-)